MPSDDPPQEVGKNLVGGGPPEAEGNLQVPRHTRPDPCRRQHGRPKCYPAPGEVQTEIDLRYLMTAPPNGHLWHKAFYLFFFFWSERRAVAHTRPAFPKMPTALSAFSLIGAPQVLGDDPPPNGVKAWGKAPLRPKEISRYRDALGHICAADNTAGRSATQELERFRSRLICGICCSPHPTGNCGTRPFLWWVQAQGRSPHTPGVCQKCPRPRRHSPC